MDFHGKRCWEKGSWEIGELEDVRQVVEDLAAELGEDQFRKRVGGMTGVGVRRVLRSPTNDDGDLVEAVAVGCWWIELYDPWAGQSKAERKAAVVHELAHVRDSHRSEWGSELIFDVVGYDEPMPTTCEAALENAGERWAQLAVAEVYGDRAPDTTEPRPLHHEFWALAVRGWAGPVPAASVSVP